MHILNIFIFSYVHRNPSYQSQKKSSKQIEVATESNADVNLPRPTRQIPHTPTATDMGWWDSLWSSSSSAEDPLRKLDPKLREFLEKESPVKYNTTTTDSSTTTQQPQSQPQSQPPARSAATATTTPRENGSNPAVAAAVPRESQFQDGRYAHLWKTYRPLAEVEAETKSDHEKLMDVLEGYKERKGQIGRAALENCALEQVDWRTCMSNPSMTDRMTLCRAQVKKFERCYMMQTVRLLFSHLTSLLDFSYFYI